MFRQREKLWQPEIAGLLKISLRTPAGMTAALWQAQIFRRSVSPIAYGKQARLLASAWRKLKRFDLWCEAEDWDWADRIEYLPRS